MIIRFPTSLYSARLREADNITYTISNEDPPTAIETFLQVPIAEIIKKLPERSFEFSPKGAEFVFSFSAPAPSDEGSNKKQFEIGQIFEFDVTENIPEVLDDVVPQTIDLIQNMNLIDLSEFDLTEEEIESLNKQSKEKFTEIVNDINNKKSRIFKNNDEIVELQKIINELNKVIEATIAIVGDGDIATKLKEQKKETEEKRDDTIELVNQLSIEAEIGFDNLLKVRELTR